MRGGSMKFKDRSIGEIGLRGFSFSSVMLLVLSLACSGLFLGCEKKESNSSLEIVLPEGQQIKYSTSGFSYYTKKDYQVFLREVVSNKELLTKAEITPSQSDLSQEKSEYEYLIPRGTTISGFLTLQVVMDKYSSTPLTAFIFSADEVIEPSVESTLLYDLIAQYPDKEIHTYQKTELRIILEYIKKFAAYRMDLFGVPVTTPPRALYNFLRNGLSIDLKFLALVGTMGLNFNYDSKGQVLSKPYPFGKPNNPPYIDESKSTPAGKLSAYESIRVDITSEALDGDDDMIFIYWRFQDKMALKDKHKWQYIFDFDSSNVVDRKNDPPFYKLESIITDGGFDLVTEWDIVVNDNNRSPELVYDCPTTINEGDTFDCVFHGVDMDKDLLRFTGLVLDFFNAKPTLEGVFWPGPTPFIQDMRLIWKPRNKNFSTAKANTLLGLVADDGKAGKAVAFLNLNMIDSNTAPYPYVDSSGQVMRQLDSGNGPPRAMQRIGGQLLDPISKTSETYYYELLILDDDNQNIKELADFDEILQPLTGTSDFETQSVTPFTAIPANAITKITLPADAPKESVDNIVNVQKFKFEHLQLNPSSVVDALSNNPSFMMSITKTASDLMTTDVVFPKGTTFDFVVPIPSPTPYPHSTYELTSDFTYPRGPANVKPSQPPMVYRKVIPDPEVRSYNLPVSAKLSAEDKKEYTTVIYNGKERIAKRFIYAWRPEFIKPKVVANFSPKDDHGGKGTSFRFEFTAPLLAQMPICGMASRVFSTTSDFPTTQSTLTCSDPDAPMGTTAFVEMSVKAASPWTATDNTYRLLPFLRNAASTTPFGTIFFTSSVTTGADNFFYRAPLPSGASPLSIVKVHNALASGYVRFSRTNCSLTTNNKALATMSPITIPKGTLITSSFVDANPPAYRPRVTFATTEAATIQALECGVLVAVRPHLGTRTTIAANTLKVIYEPNGETNLVGKVNVTHAAVSGNATTDVYTLNPTIPATFALATPLASPLIIKAGTSVRNIESTTAESYAYYVPATTQIPAGTAGTSVAIRLVRDYLPASGVSLYRPMTYYDISNNYLLSTSLVPNSVTLNTPIAGITLSQPFPLMPHFSYNLENYYNNPAITTITGSVRFFDGQIPLKNEISKFAYPPFLTANMQLGSMDLTNFYVSGLSTGSETDPRIVDFRTNPEFSKLKLRNEAFTSPLYGIVEIYRDNDGPDLVIPKGLIVSTTNRRFFKVLKDEDLKSTNTIPNSALVLVEQFFESTWSPQAQASPNPTASDLTFQWSDVNKGIGSLQFLGPNGTTFPLKVYINPSGPPAEYPIEVGDNNNSLPNGPLVPLDPLDRYYVDTSAAASGIKFTGTERPVGLMQLCRRPYKDVGDTCSPCTTPIDSTLSNNETRICYLRYKPTIEDTAKILNFEISVAESGPPIPLNPSKKSGSIQVIEANSPPKFTDSSYAPWESTCLKDFDIGKTYLFNTGLAPALSKVAAPANFTTTCLLGRPIPLQVEGTTTSVTLYMLDTDKDATNNTIKSPTISEKVFDLKTQKELTAPAFSASSFANNVTPLLAQGKKATVVLNWKPNDAESKALSTNEGFIFGIRAQDSSSVDTPKAGLAYFQTKVMNVNNAPSFGPLTLVSGTNPIYINTYYRAEMDVYDPDFATLTSPQAFTTDLSLCRTTTGTLVKHATFDLDPNMAPNPSLANDPTVCHFSGSDWDYAPLGDNWASNYSYAGNAAVTQCRIQSGTNKGKVNPDFIVPKISRIGGPYFEPTNSRVRYRFAIEWCPQDVYIGKYNVNLSVTDNGDLARSGVWSNPLMSLSLLNLNVVSNVYFIAPRYTVAPNTVSLRQTAAFSSPRNLIFPLYARNSLGNKLQYSLLQVKLPTPTPTPLGIAVDANTGILTWNNLTPTMTPLPFLTTTDPNLIPKVTVQVKDTVTLKTDMVTFAIKVQDPNIAPYEEAPQIKTVDPANDATLFINEKQTTYFEAQAFDANNAGVNADALWAVWYLDDQIVHEEELFTKVGYNYPVTRYGWRPTDSDGSVIGKDNGTTLTPGLHSLRVAITDGNDWSQAKWLVQVRNSYIVPDFFYSVQDSRKLVETASNRPLVNTFKWYTELPFASILTNQPRPTEYLIFGGEYLRNSVLRKYLWRLDIKDGVVSTIPTNTSTGGWNYYEYLVLSESATIQRLAARPDSNSNAPVIYGITRASKYGPYGNYKVGFKFIADNLATMPTNLTGTSYDCPTSGTDCDKILYESPNFVKVTNNKTTAQGTYNGNINLVAIGDREFYIDQTFKNLYWDVGQLEASKKRIYPAPTAVPTNNYTINSMAINKSTNRLYMSLSDNLIGGDKILVFNIAPALSSPTADISTPIFTYDVNHPLLKDPNTGQPLAVTLPADIAIAPKRGNRTYDQVFVFLKGSGGLLIINDPGDRIPDATDFTFTGFGYGSSKTIIAASPLDVTGQGTKLGYEPVSDNIIGISRDGRQVYTISPDDRKIASSAHVASYSTTYVTATDVRMDSLVLMPLTGSIYFIDRKYSMIYKGR